MSVIINGEIFPIFLQDSEASIKDRYCLDKFTIPALCTFELKKQNKQKQADCSGYPASKLRREINNTRG